MEITRDNLDKLKAVLAVASLGETMLVSHNIDEMAQQVIVGSEIHKQLYGSYLKLDMLTAFSDKKAIEDFRDKMKPLQALAQEAGMQIDTTSQDSSKPPIPQEYVPVVRKLLANPDAVANLTDFLKDPNNSIVKQIVQERFAAKTSSGQLDRTAIDKLLTVAKDKQGLNNISLLLRTPGVTDIAKTQTTGANLTMPSEVLDKLLTVVKDNTEVTNISNFMRNNSALVAYATDKNVAGTANVDSSKLLDAVIAAGKDTATLDKITAALNDKPDRAKFTLNEIITKIHNGDPDSDEVNAAKADLLLNHKENVTVLLENNIVDAIAQTNPQFKALLDPLKTGLKFMGKQGVSHVNIVSAPLAQPSAAEIAAAQQKLADADKDKKDKEKAVDDKKDKEQNTFGNLLADILGPWIAPLIEGLINMVTKGEGEIASHAKDISQSVSKAIAGKLGDSFGVGA